MSNLSNSKILLDHFNEELTSETMDALMSNERSSRAYITEVLPDRQVEDGVSAVELYSMVNYTNEVMPINPRGGQPDQDDFPAFKAQKVELMSAWLEAPFSEQMIFTAANQLRAMKMHGASRAELEKFVTGLFAELFKSRRSRMQGLCAYQVGQVISNFAIDIRGGTPVGIDYGFNSKDFARNSIHRYGLGDMGNILDGRSIVTNHPVQYLLERLVQESKGEVNEIWMGKHWTDWFLSWEGWYRNDAIKLPQPLKSSTSEDKLAKGASLLHEAYGVRFIGIHTDVVVSDNDGKLRKVNAFEPDSIVALNTNTLGEFVYSKMWLNDNPAVKMLCNHPKLNLYQIYNTKNPEKDTLYRSGTNCLGAITGTKEMVRMSMKEVA